MQGLQPFSCLTREISNPAVKEDYMVIKTYDCIVLQSSAVIGSCILLSLFLEVPQEPKPKRQKIEDDDFSDTELEDIEPLPEATVPVLQKYKKPVKRHVYTRPPFGKDHITVTDTEGRRVFVPVAKKDEEVKLFPPF